MLITKEVEIGWNASHKKYYTDRNYIYTKMGDKFKVKVEDLPDNSRAEVVIKCDYCQNEFIKYFRDYINSKDNLINKDCCYDCASLKMKEIRDYKQENNMLSKSDFGYWTYKENRLKELDYYIKKYGNLNKIQYANKDYKIISTFHNYNHSIIEAIEELGYNIDETVNYDYKHPNKDKIYTPKGYYDDINNLVDIIQPFIDKYKRFPTTVEIYRNLGIGSRQLQKHGGIYALKRYMNYNDKYDLKDDSGFYNLSTYEYIVAQWLINNNISYKRDRHPFPEHEGKYMSDFTLYLKDGDIIHVEVWGGEGQDYYDKVKEMKLELYQKYNINLISINSDVFLYYNLDKIRNILNDLFSPYINQTIMFVPDIVLMPSINMTDDEIFEVLMKYSQDKDYLPQRKTLTKNKRARLYDEIKLRYGSYYAFAEKYNKLVYRNRGYWDIDKILNVFSDIVAEYDELSKKNVKDYIAKNKHLHNFLDIITTHGGFIKLKLLFIYKNIHNLKLSPNDNKFINNVLHNKYVGKRLDFSSEQIQMAKDILASL